MMVKQDQQWAKVPLLHPNIRKFLNGIQNKTAPNLNYVALEAIANASGDVFRLVDIYRSFVTQHGLFLMGRSRVGAIVTNADSGDSFHNWYCAVDMIFAKTGFGSAVYRSKVYSADDLSQLYLDTGLVAWATACGVRWGGSWGDINHFETFSLPAKSYRKQENAVSAWWEKEEVFDDKSLLASVKKGFRSFYRLSLLALALYLVTRGKHEN